MWLRCMVYIHIRVGWQNWVFSRFLKLYVQGVWIFHHYLILNLMKIHGLGSFDQKGGSVIFSAQLVFNFYHIFVFPVTSGPITSGRVKLAVTLFVMSMLSAIFVCVLKRLFKFLHASHDMRIRLFWVLVLAGVLGWLFKNPASVSTILLVMTTLHSIVHGVNATMLLE